MKKYLAYTVIGTAAVALSTALARPQVQADESNPLQPKQVLATYELMDLVVEPTFQAFREAAVKEPEGRNDWKALYKGAYSTAELMNLLFSRSDEDYMAEPDWAKLTAQTRSLAAQVGDAVKEQDYPAAKEHYLAMVQSCNQCHVRFIGEDEVVIEPYPEDAE